MKTSHKLIPSVEGMESRALLSTVNVVTAHIVAPVIVHLNGTATGTYSARQANPDFPREFSLHGSGNLGLKSRALVSGTIDEGGFTTHPGPHGRLTVTDRRGSLYLSVTSQGFDAQSNVANYTVTGGTGIYRHAQGQGTVTLSFRMNPNTMPASLHVRMNPNTMPVSLHYVEHGSFQATFQG